MITLDSFRRITSGTRYVPNIDGLRFLAIVPVVLFHLNSRTWRAYTKESGSTQEIEWFTTLSHWLGAKTGVELFFVISGFILAMPFLKASMDGERMPSLRRFFSRRLTRLEPPYVLATLGAFVFLALTTSPDARRVFVEENGFSLLQSFGASLFYLHGMLFQTLPTVIPVAWSLEIEFQFYVLAPLIFAMYLMTPGRLGKLVVGVLLLIALILSINLIQTQIGALIRFLLLRYLHLFLLGMVLAQGFLNYRLLSAAAARSWGWDVAFVLCLGLLLLSESHLTDYRSQTSVAWEVVRAMCMSVVFIGAFLGLMASRLMCNRAVTTIGGMCYSIYLLHLPIQQVLVPKLVQWVDPENFFSALAWTSVITLPITLAICLAFFALVERPCMNPDWPAALIARFRRIGQSKKNLVAPP